MEWEVNVYVNVQLSHLGCVQLQLFSQMPRLSWLEKMGVCEVDHYLDNFVVCI